MCEIMTICAAIAFTVLYFAAKRRGRSAKALFTTALMFWGAALMWSVDCTANAMEGEPFFDLSLTDSILGAIILAAGCAVFAALSFMRREDALR